MELTQVVNVALPGTTTFKSKELQSAIFEREAPWTEPLRQTEFLQFKKK